MLQLDEFPISLSDTARMQARVIYALMLRGIRSRFFGNGLGFLFASVVWPLGHLAAIMVIHIVTGRIAPFGDSAILFFATGLVPFITFNYISRLTMLGSLYDRPLTAFPVVKVIDLLLARIFIEILGGCVTLATLIVLLCIAGVDPMPQDFVQASFAYGASILLGVGMGIINGVIALAFRAWFTGYVLVVLLLYAASGIFFVADDLPEVARYYLSFNPLLHAVEWMRSAYYPGYGSLTLDKTYLLSWALCTIFGGLALERLVRGRLLMDG